MFLTNCSPVEQKIASNLHAVSAEIAGAAYSLTLTRVAFEIKHTMNYRIHVAREKYKCLSMKATATLRRYRQILKRGLN